MKKNAKSRIILKRMNDLQISKRQLAEHVMRSVTEISSWLKGEIELPWNCVWKICDVLVLDECDILHQHE